MAFAGENQLQDALKELSDEEKKTLLEKTYSYAGLLIQEKKRIDKINSKLSENISELVEWFEADLSLLQI